MVNLAVVAGFGALRPRASVVARVTDESLVGGGDGFLAAQIRWPAGVIVEYGQVVNRRLWITAALTCQYGASRCRDGGRQTGRRGTRCLVWTSPRGGWSPWSCSCSSSPPPCADTYRRHTRPRPASRVVAGRRCSSSWGRSVPRPLWWRSRSSRGCGTHVRRRRAPATCPKCWAPDGVDRVGGWGSSASGGS